MASGVNLKEFTLAVDQAAQKMDQGLPQLLIHSIARKIPEERAQALYDYFSISFFLNISLENMLSLGKEELENLPKFWEMRPPKRQSCANIGRRFHGILHFMQN